MKSLKSICGANLTHSILEVSILGDIDDQIEAYDNSIKDRIEKWINDNYSVEKLKISNEPNKDGLYEVTARKAQVKNKNITSLTNGMFEWKEIQTSFTCSNCNLKSLEGAPNEIGEDFSCSHCNLLKSLNGAPKKVGGDFNCFDCTSLKSLEGASKNVGGRFICQLCDSLESLKGAPDEIGKDFYCSYCDSLKSLNGATKKVGRDFTCSSCSELASLEGAPKEVGKDFYCYKCKTKFTREDVIKVSNVKGKIKN